jgi:site-specific recombinase XerD
LEKLTATHIEIYLHYLSFYIKPKNDYSVEEYENHERGKARKLSSLRSLLSYCYKRELINKNVSVLVDIPKTHEKPIIRLEPNEVADLLSLVESGRLLTEGQKKYHKFTAKRDIALLTLFLGTGIRISECVGLNINDFDFNTDGFTVTRKGGGKTILYFGLEVHQTILDYLEVRQTLAPLEGHENALFLSLQRKRLSNRAIQNLVKKYAQHTAPLKNISPHKLRSTYGTTLYRETGDIYLVADVLGHRDVNTTRKHYAAQSDENRRKAARAVTLRMDEPEK